MSRAEVVLAQLSESMRRAIEEVPNMPTEVGRDHLWTLLGDWYTVVETARAQMVSNGEVLGA